MQMRTEVGSRWPPRANESVTLAELGWERAGGRAGRSSGRGASFQTRPGCSESSSRRTPEEHRESGANRARPRYQGAEFVSVTPRAKTADEVLGLSFRLGIP